MSTADPLITLHFETMKSITKKCIIYKHFRSATLTHSHPLTRMHAAWNLMFCHRVGTCSHAVDKHSCSCLLVFLSALSLSGSRGGLTTGSTPGWVTISSQSPIWGLLKQYSEDVLPLLTCFVCTGAWTENPSDYQPSCQTITANWFLIISEEKWHEYKSMPCLYTIKTSLPEIVVFWGYQSEYG